MRAGQFICAPLAMVAVVSTGAAAFLDVCNGTPNEMPIWNDELAFIRAVPNGKLFMAGSSELNNKLFVAHVYGSSYEMGYAYGSLLYDEINTLVPEIFDYMEKAVEDDFSKLSPVLAKIVAEFGVPAALDFTWKQTSPFIKQYYIDELQGVADATGMTFDELKRVSIFPEMIRASCSIMGAWGPAVHSSANGGLLQLRALDWETAGPFQQFPVLHVYHPDQTDGKLGHDFATLGWAGLIGAITGISSADVGMCEKVWDSYEGFETYKGIPWTYMFRDILNFDSSIDEALSRIASSHRTCSIHLGVGAARDEDPFRLVDYSVNDVHIYNDVNFPEYGAHTNKGGLLYYDKHVQPSQGDPCLPALVNEVYGQLTPEVLIRNVTALHRTGDMHIAVMDFAGRNLYVSNAAVYDEAAGSAQPAYDRSFVQVSMDALWNEPKPTVGNIH